MGGIGMRKVTGSIPRGGEYFEKCPGTATIREEARKHFYLTAKADYCRIPLIVKKFLGHLLGVFYIVDPLP